MTSTRLTRPKPDLNQTRQWVDAVMLEAYAQVKIRNQHIISTSWLLTKPYPDPVTNHQTHALNLKALLALMLSVAMVTIDISLTSTAVPAIASGLGVSPAQTIWVINIYYLTVVASLLPLGALGEIIGHRRVFLVGLGIFALGALASGLSESLTALMGARGLQGIGSAAVSATTPALIKTLYPSDRLGRGLGLYAMVVGVAFTAGPTMVSGVLSVANWPWLYLGTLPFILLAMALAIKGVPNTDRADRAFDPVAALLCALLFAALLTALSSLGHLKPLALMAGLIAAAVFGYSLARRESGKQAPILAIDLFRIRLFALSSMTSITAFVVQALVFVVLPLLFTINLGFSEVQAGLLITPWPAA
ncbi:MAG TPA: MFS transporter, partial [Orrella sp.]